MKKWVVATLLGMLGALLSPPREARADEDTIVIITAVTLVSAAFGADVAFTAYDINKMKDNKEPDFKWMTAQTIVTSPQAVLSHIPMVLGSVEKKDPELALLFLPAAMWGNQMATFGAWSMGSQSVKSGPRYGVSWLIGTNLPLTTGAISSIANDLHVSRPWLAIPEMALTAPQVVAGVYQGVHDKNNRPGWIAIAAWSGALFVHGTVSLVVSLTHKESDDPPPEPPLPPPPLPPPPPPPPPPPFRLDQPVQPVPPPGTEPEPPMGRLSPKAPRLHADIGPAPVTDGFRVVPGVTVFGTF